MSNILGFSSFARNVSILEPSLKIMANQLKKHDTNELRIFLKRICCTRNQKNN